MDCFKFGTISSNDAKELILCKGCFSYESVILSKDEEYYLNEVIKLFLTGIGKENIYDIISYCFNEIINNAKKANIKRAHFLDNKLDITNPAEYEEGMKTFRDTLSDDAKVIRILNEHSLFLRTDFEIINDTILIKVTNNSLIHLKELELINEKREQAHAFNDIESVFSIVKESREGAGLGIIITILMLRKIGLSKDNLQIDINGNLTESKILIPLSILSFTQINSINLLIQKEIEELPQFPEKIIKLGELLDDKEADFNKISVLIEGDPGLTAEILRHSNSVYYSYSKKISTIKEAVKIIGLSGLKSLVFAYETRAILTKKYKTDKMVEIWDHSYKTAFYAYHLAVKFNKKNMADEIYTAGLLHDLGKIITFAINPVIMNKINKLCLEKGISLTIIENITNGFYHDHIGALIARKWQFPDPIVSGIEYHHTPRMVRIDSEKDLVNIVYIADNMAKKEFTKNLFFQLENYPLETFGLEEYDSFHKMQEELGKLYLDAVSNV